MSLPETLTELNTNLYLHNAENGTLFLNTNRQRIGVKELPSGLQYEIVKQGTGEIPKIFHDVTCNYHGTLIDGTVFDSSVNRGTPVSFPVSMVIRGCTEALQLMPVGSIWRLYIPPHLAYGEKKAGSLIGPNSTLIFEVELLDLK